MIPEISIIVPARNAGRIISDCLDALQNQELDFESYEVILVDDGSSDDTALKGNRDNVRLIRQQPLGPAAARNLGARHAHGQILLFTDADCRPEKNWIHEMTLPFRDSTVSGVKGIYRTDQKSLTARFVQMEYEGKYQYMAKQGDIDFIDTYSAGFRKEVFLSLGGFDETFPGASVEDQEFSFRMHEAGYRMVFTSKAVVTHFHVDSFSKYLRKKFKIGFWKFRVLKRHPSKITHDSHTPPWLKIQIPLAFIMLFFVLSIPWLGFIPFEISILSFFAAAATEISLCYKKDGLGLALVAPFLLLLRSWGLGMGLITGFLSFQQKTN